MRPAPAPTRSGFRTPSRSTPRAACSSPTARTTAFSSTSQEGTLLDTWYQFSRNSGIFITVDDMLYATDSESSDRRGHGDWKRGIRVGSARTGEVMYFIPDPADANDGPLAGTSFSEGVAVDAAGNIYAAEVGPRDLKKYVRTEEN